MTRRPVDVAEREVWNVQDYEYMLPDVGAALLELMGLLKQLAALDIPERVTDTQLMAMDDLECDLQTCCTTLRAVLGHPARTEDEPSLF